MNYEIITSAELAKHRKTGKLGIAALFVVAWQNQQDTVKFLTNFAQYIQGRQDQQQMNQALAPYPRPVRARKWQPQ